MDIEPTGTDFWYHGYQRSGIRLLNGDERKRLRIEQVMLGVGSALSGIAVPFSLVFSLVVGVLLPEWFDRIAPHPGLRLFGRLIFFVLLLAALGVIGLLVILTKYGIQRCMGVGKDLQGGFVNRYSIAGHTLEILPYSNRVWMVDREPHPWFRAPAVQERLATPPRDFQRIPGEIADVEIGNYFARAPRRNLTDAERAELRKIAAKEWVFPFFAAAFFQIWFWSVLLYALLSGAVWSRWPSLLGLLPVGGFALIFLHGAKTALCDRVALRRDVARGTVAQQRIGEHQAEVLPESGRTWTVNSQPALWRRKDWL